AEEYFRSQLHLPLETPVNLWSIAESADGRRPSLSLPLLTKVAIYGSDAKKLTLQGIYGALIDRFRYFREHRTDNKWKNSIRHALSLYQAFVKVDRPIHEAGHGDYWTLDLSLGEGYKRVRKR
ncbi:hypothetical protein FB451DRAFT_960229, partial [Mycena latifolia]